MVACAAHLQGVCCYLIGEANAAAFLLQVYDEPRAVLLYVPHRHLKLPRTVALQ